MTAAEARCFAAEHDDEYDDTPPPPPPLVPEALELLRELKFPTPQAQRRAS